MISMAGALLASLALIGRPVEGSSLACSARARTAEASPGLGAHRDDRADASAFAVKLEMTCKNLGKAALRISKHNLPWVNPNVVELISVELNDGAKTLKRSGLIADPIPTVVTIPVGGSVIGSIDLLESFPELVESLARGGVVVFWSYAPEMIPSYSLETSAGAVILGRRGAKSRNR